MSPVFLNYFRKNNLFKEGKGKKKKSGLKKKVLRAGEDKLDIATTIFHTHSIIRRS